MSFTTCMVRKTSKDRQKNRDRKRCKTVVCMYPDISVFYPYCIVEKIFKKLLEANLSLSRSTGTTLLKKTPVNILPNPYAVKTCRPKEKLREDSSESHPVNPSVFCLPINSITK